MLQNDRYKDSESNYHHNQNENKFSLMFHLEFFRELGHLYQNLLYQFIPIGFSNFPVLCGRATLSKDASSLLSNSESSFLCYLGTIKSGKNFLFTGLGTKEN
jgi:hypothetical protein